MSPSIATEVKYPRSTHNTNYRLEHRRATEFELHIQGDQGEAIAQDLQGNGYRQGQAHAVSTENLELTLNVLGIVRTLWEEPGSKQWYETTLLRDLVKEGAEAEILALNVREQIVKLKLYACEPCTQEDADERG